MATGGGDTTTGGRSRRSYSDAERERALNLYRHHGPAEAARRCEIPAPTIRKWAQRSGLTSQRTEAALAGIEAARLTWAQRRAEVCARSGDLAAALLERAAASGKAREIRELMASFAIAVDKAQLLDGQPTERVVSDVERRERVRELRDELAARRETAR